MAVAGQHDDALTASGAAKTLAQHLGLLQEIWRVMLSHSKQHGNTASNKARQRRTL
jgi:hypothetical protein